MSFQHGVVDQISIGAVGLDDTLAVAAMNPAAERILGLQAGLTHGLPLTDALAQVANPVEAQHLAASALNTLKSGENARVELAAPGKRLSFKFSPLNRDGASEPALLILIEDVTEQQLEKEQLFESNQMLKLILDNIPQRVFWKDKDSSFLGCNLPMALDVGLHDPEAIVGLNDYDIGSLADAEHFRADDRSVLDAGKAKLNFEETQDRPDGSLAWLRTSKVPLRTRSGAIFGVLGVYEDITDHKRAEFNLAASEHRFQQLFEALPVGAVVFDAMTLRFVLFNDVAPRLLGYTRAEYAQLGMADVEADHDEALIRRNVKRMLRGERLEFETRFRSKAGEERDILIQVLAVTLAGRPSILSIQTDISQRKQAEAVLRENRERLDLALHSAKMGAWSWDIATNRRTYDPQTCLLLGLNTQTYDGSVAERRQIVHPDDLPLVDAARERALKEMSPFEAEYRVLWLDGSVHYIMSHGKLSCDERGRPLRIDGVMWDTTERKLAVSRLQAALIEKESLLREIHHRVKNNLQAMISLMEMQADRTPDAGARSFLAELQGQVRAMALVYEQVYQSESLANVGMAPYLERLTANVVQAFAGGRRIAVDLDIEPITLGIDFAMPCGLIVNELVTNIVKYAFPPHFQGEASLKVALHRERTTCRLTISDNGVGLPADIGVLSTPSLGLRLVRLWATHQLGGTLTTSSSPGTTFDIAFGVS